MLTYIDKMYWLLAIGLILKYVLLCWLKTTQYKSSGISSANLLRALEIFDLPPAISPELNKCPGSNPVRWLERGVKNAIYIKVNNPTLYKDGAATNFQETTSLFSGQVYQNSRPEVVSPSLMKDEGSSENSKIWKIFCFETTSFKL